MSDDHHNRRAITEAYDCGRMDGEHIGRLAGIEEAAKVIENRIPKHCWSQEELRRNEELEAALAAIRALKDKADDQQS